MDVLITGANRGIGRALFDGYLARRDNVVGTCRGARPADGTWLQADVTQASYGADLAAAWDGKPLDLLICNAGVYLDKGQNLADGYDAQTWAASFAVNVTGVFVTIQALLPNLQMSGNPKIAIMSSQMGSDTRARGSSYIYRASKAAALNLGRNLAVDLKPLGLPVGIYHPGWVQTDMGGANADIAVEQSAQGLIERFDALSVETTGTFEMWNGEQMPF